MSDIVVMRNYASPSELAMLHSVLDIAEAAPRGPYKRTIGSMRTEVVVSDRLSAICDPTLLAQAISMRDRVIDTLCETFPRDAPQPLDLAALAEMREGDSHELHADAERETPTGWVPNHCGWRSTSAVLYLSTCGVDFEGGVISFPTVGETIEPEAGLLVVFTAYRQHAHQVSTVTKGRRRTMPVWLRDASWRGVPSEIVPS